ncbi:putative Fe-Mo cluster-binding NifX family protein [Ruminiclostridium sufflavum DSM 19573]|uniref:Putative Fe-Mo cluster-binding NifX family protein n=1 Tax=Ruminiclostridium sufflavum DSM 19573 TaxID=1121337 RepID=A0A318XN38_9FIRM|nr:NifB/NifX family molybdenum-iron cluster-binding protein [Ruminiclostridium sufflavum]PYG87371.1 putative Fe-Mo cluster-binding NifX family protein [Ruminiclostridium sufflavum DSM 19573]
MTYRVAVSSTDGKVVNRHFGHTEKFLIFEITGEDKYCFVESRSIQPCCNNGEHEMQAFYNAIEALEDVQAVIVSKIGEGAAAFLESKGLTIYEAPYPIEPIIQKILDEKLYEVDKWRFHISN